MSETSKNRAIEVLNRDQNQLDNVYVNQSEYNAPEKIEKITVTENSDGTWSQNKEIVDSGLKDNIEPISSSTSLTKVLQLNPVYYKWRKDIVPSSFLKAYGEGRQIGLIAQEVEDIIPEVIKDGTLYDKQWKGINYSKLTAMLIGAVKEQQEQIEELKTRITELES